MKTDLNQLFCVLINYFPMSFLPKDNVQFGWNLSWAKKRASTAIGYGAILIKDGAGFLTVATSTSHVFQGISMFTAVSTDTDYASNTLVPYLDLTNRGRDLTVIATTTTGGGLANEGVLYDLSTSLVVNIAASAVKAFLYTKFISDTVCEGVIQNPTILGN